MLAGLLTLWMALLVAQGTPVGDALHRLLVEKPAQRLSRVHRGHILLAIVMFAVIVALAWLLDDDGRMLVRMGLPEFLSFAAAIDLSALLDLAAVTAIAATAVRFRSVAIWLRHQIVPRRPRTRRQRVLRQRPPANDDEGGRALAFAA